LEAAAPGHPPSRTRGGTVILLVFFSKIGNKFQGVEKESAIFSRVGMFSLKNGVKIGKDGVGDFLLS